MIGYALQILAKGERIYLTKSGKIHLTTNREEIETLKELYAPCRIVVFRNRKKSKVCSSRKQRNIRAMSVTK